MIPDFDQMLEKYADVVVNIGLCIQKGQRLVIGGPAARGVALEEAPLVRQIVAKAYQAGARFVEVLWGDPQLLLTRYQLAPRDSFDQISEWMIDARLHFVEKGDSLLTVRGYDPDLLKEQDPKLVGQEMTAILMKYKSVSEYISRNAVNWCVIAGATPAWAARVFPDLPVEQAVERLWQAIFSICRIDQADPVAAWEKHVRELAVRTEYMNAKGYAGLHYTGPGTDLKIGLPEGAIWKSARFASESGIDYIGNLPTEEIFSLPHRERIDGTIKASRPLSYGGSLIEDFSLTYEKGRVVNFSARRGQDILAQLLDTDEGSRSLGEVSFVPHGSPISQTGILFYDALIDENAASHLAFGHAYRFSLPGGEKMTPEQFMAAGGNESANHVDFMVGSNELDIDGITKDGAVEAIMRKGEWAFQAG